MKKTEDSEDSEIKYSINVQPVPPFCFLGKKSMFKVNNKGIRRIRHIALNSATNISEYGMKFVQSSNHRHQNEVSEIVQLSLLFTFKSVTDFHSSPSVFINDFV